MDLKTLFDKYNYPSKSKFYQLAKKEGLKTTLKEIEQFLNKQQVQQIFSKKRPQRPGYIVAFEPESRYQMDLIDMSKFSQKNGGNSWIMLLIDIFSRKIYCYLIKNKTEKNLFDVLSEFLKHHHPYIIMSDNESGFKSTSIKALMNKYEVVNNMVEVQDHKALGVVDRAVQTIKNVIYKYMKAEQTTTYYKRLDAIVKAYNDTPNSGILNIAPNDADEKNNRDALQILNHRKDNINKKNRIHFKIGDIVRRKLKTSSFQRSYDERYSNKQFFIKSIQDGRATLDNYDKSVSLRFLIKAEKVDDEHDNDVLGDAKKENKINRNIKREGLDKADIINEDVKEGPRRSTRNKNK
jgi:hypothetical protein